MAEAMAAQQQRQTGHHGGPFGYNTNYLSNSMQYGNPTTNLEHSDILDATQSDLMESFFDNPDDPSLAPSNIVSMSNMSNNMPSMVNSKHESGLSGSTFNFDFTNATVDPSSTMADLSETQYQTHSGDVRMDQHGHHPSTNFYSPRHMHFDNDDVNGASQLLNLRGGQPQSQITDNGAMGAASWGNMMAPANPFGNPATAEGNSRMTSRSSSDSAFAHGYPTQPHFMTQQQLHDMQMRMAQYNQQQNGYIHTRHPSLSLDTNQHQLYGSQSVSAHGQYPARTPMPRFGSDSQIQGAYAYAAENYTALQHDKEGNLMHVPLATQAAVNGHRQSHASRDMSHPSQRTYHVDNTPKATHGFPGAISSPHGMGGLPVTSSDMPNVQESGGQWFTASRRAAVRAELEDAQPDEFQHPRKRRKSQAQREEDDEYQPEPRIQGTIPKRGPKVPKADLSGHEDDYDAFTTPQSKESAYRRKSSATTHAGNASAPVSSEDATTPPNEGSASKKKGGAGKSRQNLSEAQKRANHIESEQKRRNVIKNNYNELDGLVPGLNNGKSGLSRAEQLKETVEFLLNLTLGNESIEEQLSQAGRQSRRDDYDDYDEDDGAGAGASGIASY